MSTESRDPILDEVIMEHLKLLYHDIGLVTLALAPHWNRLAMFIGPPGSKSRANLPKLIAALDNSFYAQNMMKD